MDALIEGLKKLESLEESVANLANFADLDRKRALVNLRREYAENLTQLSLAVRSSTLLSAYQDVAAEFGRRISEVRTVAALHQAEWPAVLSNSESAAYMNSARNLSRTNSSFCVWARSKLKELNN